MGTLGVLTIGRIVMTLRIRMKTVPSCIRQVSLKKNVLQGFSYAFDLGLQSTKASNYSNAHK